MLRLKDMLRGAVLSVAVILLSACGAPAQSVGQPTVPVGTPTAPAGTPPSPDFTTSPGFAAAYETAAWVVESVSADRRSAVIRVAGGGCESYGRHDIRDEGSLQLDVWSRVSVPVEDGFGCTDNFTAQAVRVNLPRSLAGNERLIGGCRDDPRLEGCGGLASFPLP